MTKNTSILDRLPPSKSPELSPRMKRLLRLGNDGTYVADFDYEWAIALSAVNAGKGEEWLRKVLQNKGPWYETIRTKPLPFGGKQKAEKYVSKLYEKAVAYRKEHPPWRSKQDASVALAEYAAWVQTLPNWHGKKGNRNLEVFLAVLYVGIQVGSNVVSFSTRQLAEHTSKSQKTIDRALKELRAERWILLVQEKRSITEAPTYKIASSLYGRRLTNIILPSRGVGSSESSTVPMIFDFLGISAYRAWSLLNEEEGTEEGALVKTTRLSKSTIREALLRLESFGLAFKKDGAWYRVEVDLDALAIEYGIPELREAKKRKHAEQRAKRMHDLGLGDRLEYHRKHDLVGEGRNATVDEHSPALVNARKPKEDASEEGLPQARIQTREGTVVSTAGTTVRTDGGTALPERGTQPVPSDHGQRLPVEPGSEVGHDTPDLLADHGARQPVGGMAVGWERPEEREAACLGCGQIQTFSAPDLTPYKCAHCKVHFVWVDELARVA
jgi:DNA-binding transcriptional regulator YhcF (GntR family)